MKWRGFRHPSPDPTDLRLHRPVRDCWTDWIPRTGASDTELANALRRIEGTRNAIGASPVIAQQYADECSAFLHLHHEALIARLSAAPSEGSAPINYQSADSRLIVEGSAPCPCRESTCTESWEPGCGLGTSMEHARVASTGQVPDWNMAQHWIDRYAADIDEELQLDRVAEALGLPDPTEGAE